MLATRVTAQMVFDDGFFHADPHPGNFFVEPAGQLGIVDFGMVGEVDERLRDQLGSLLVALANTDSDRLTAAVISLSTAQGPVDRATLRKDLAALVARNEGLAVSEIHLGSVVEEALTIVRHHHLQLPRELALLLKMVVMNEGMAVKLDPDFRLGEVLSPYARRLVARQMSPAAFARRLGQVGIDVAQLGAELPDHLRRMMAVLEGSGLDVHLRADEIEPLVARAERVGNRLVAGVIAAAFIEGLSELMAVDPERWRSWERPMFTVGLGAVGTLGGYLAWTARRAGRRVHDG